MGFEYKKKGHDGDSMWTSYSDLFLGLSIVFLLLYVTASLKQGTDGIKQSLENQRLVKENEDIRQQLKVYETLKQDYLQQQANADEQANYQELMDKLNLLQDEAKEEKNKLIQQANENEKKAQAVNKYQAMIRNIINTNLISKARIKSRDTLIDTKDDIIDEKSSEIKNLEQTVAAKAQTIEQTEKQLAQTQTALDTRMKQLKNAYAAQKMSKQAFEAKQAALQKDMNTKLMALRERNEKAQTELEQASKELQATESRLASAQGEVEKLGVANQKLQGDIAEAGSRHAAEVAKMKADFDAQKGREKAAFDAQIAKEKLSGAAKAAREAAFKAAAEKKAGELAGQIADLDKKYKDSQGALARANENLNARKNLASKIKENFGKYGVKADVDAGTGDVLLSFGDTYFDTGAANLKPKMREILQQAMPAYSASLFENDKIANKIQSVEIVGFASPTYKGKYIDPTSLNPEDREAVNFNLDLSYGRAKSIFEYVFDKNKMAFKHQQRLLPLVKVTGRSFLANDKARDPAQQGTGTDAFCRQNDCAKLQRVIIKFTLKD